MKVYISLSLSIYIYIYVAAAGTGAAPRQAPPARQEAQARSSRTWPECLRPALLGWHYLSNATCLMRPRFAATPFVLTPFVPFR